MSGQDLSRGRDATIIAFPGRVPDDGIPVEDPPDPDEWSFDDLDGLTLTLDTTEADDPTTGCRECGGVLGSHEDDCGQDPEVMIEAGGRWVWQEAGEPPDAETPVGMVAHRITTMCRWTHRHIMEERQIPQPCCYSVIVTTTRLPGPVRTERNWLAMQQEGPS